MSFNTKDLLRQTIGSLLEHCRAAEADLRVKVFDNGSSDGSFEMLAAEFPEVEAVRSERNLGFGEANNRLVAQSTADYVLLLNSDVIVVEDFLTPLRVALRTDPRSLVAAPRLVFPDGSVQYSAQQFPSLSYECACVIRGKRLGRLLTPLFDSDRKLREVLEVDLTDSARSRSPDFVWATCWLLRRSDLPDTGIFDRRFPMYDEDLDFCRRVGASGWKLRYVADAKLIHIGGASTASSAQKHRLMVRARRRYYARHHGAASAIAYVMIVTLLSALTKLAQSVPKPSWLPARLV